MALGLLEKWIPDFRTPKGEVRRDGRLVQALGVAAGTEPFLYLLASRGINVTATDIYGHGTFAVDTNFGGVLNPDVAELQKFSRGITGWERTGRLRFQFLDALSLHKAFPTAQWDVLFSFSSIEHFGGREQTAKAVTMMAKQIRPGGLLILTTEVVVAGHVIRIDIAGNTAPGARPEVHEFLTPDLVQRHVIQPALDAGLQLLEPVDYTLGDDVLNSAQDYPKVLEKQRTADPCGFPHLLLNDIKIHGGAYTSIFLAFEKPLA